MSNTSSKVKPFFKNLVSQLDIEVSSFLSFELDSFCIVSIIPFYENLSIIFMAENIKKLSL
ncbi:hypothetical protein KY380_27705, partial [Pseudomonas sp. HD6421]|nr:hypothetical protein [Pseudomonas sp. HD6421]